MMKNKIMPILFLFAFCSLQAQEKIMYIMKDGNIIGLYNLLSGIDSIAIIDKSPIFGSFIDKRDNIEYKTVQIGNQKWMAENLKATKYNDGTNIPHVTDNSQWDNLTTPAYCYYDNDISNANTYGPLYNWYVVSTGKLCPQGWHVPSDNEWAELENYLADNGFNYDGSINGGRGRIAKAMASENGWGSSIEQGTVGNTDYPEYRNKSGYSALPGGLRSDEGAFHYIGYYGFWWSSTEFSANYIYIRSLSYNGANVLWTEYGKRRGFSIRCVRD